MPVWKEWGQNVLCIEARQNPYCINDPLTQDSPIRAFKKHGDGVKVAAYGLKMLQCLRRNYETQGVLYGANRREREHGEVVRSGIYTVETVHIVERKKTIIFSYQDIKNGNQIIIQKQLV
jgi:hypothetical protein